MAIYRDAELIKLHDTGVVIQRSGSFEAQAYPGAPEEKVTTNGDNLALVAQIFGIVPPTQQDHSPRDGQNISKIEAKIRGERVVDIKVTSVITSKDGPAEVTNEITYSGGFSVWWVS